MAQEKAKAATESKVKDFVCGKEVDPGSAIYTSTHDGKTYYFDSDACKKRFDKDSERYVMAMDE